MKNQKQFSRNQIAFTMAAFLYVSILLTWQHFNGGVVSHHILHRADMPAISNWWGALVLPLVSWLLVGRIDKREQGLFSKAVLIGLIGSMLYGIVLSLAFFNGLDQLASLMGPGILLLALFIPIYRAECVLGFILSLTVGFGAILPTVFTIVIGPLAYLLYRYVRPIPRGLLSMLSK